MKNSKEFSTALFESGAIQFGTFYLKSGIKSPFYLDLRRLISYPELLIDLGNMIQDKIDPNEFDLICGIPYAGISFATTLAIQIKKPMVMIRKESKNYGTKKIIEGVYQPQDRCLLIEDVITSGQSILETIPNFIDEHLSISKIIVLVDRMQGGLEFLQEKGYQIKSLFTINEILTELLAQQLITEAQYQDSLDFISQNQVKKPQPKLFSPKRNFIKDKLTQIKEEKQSNLILSLDVYAPQVAFELIREVGKSICMLKLHTDSWDYFSYREVEILNQLKHQYNFLILEDRKFADIGSTMISQVNAKIYKMKQWADAFTCHAIAGFASINALAHEIGEDKALILIGSMSSDGALTDSLYLKKTVQFAEDIPQVIGIVSQQPIQSNTLWQFTPGVKLAQGSDGMGQLYNTPQYIFKEKQADFAIVGRGILDAVIKSEEAEKYRKICWEAKNN
ncbi:MAG: orotidine-5'-phosphate decarboxylase [Chitinophagales bacterium]|jgi:uridine monophosphate synthetase|nr:orotidine-5'-phosphate decarboxylase [Chitinophagales bacterium]